MGKENVKCTSCPLVSLAPCQTGCLIVQVRLNHNTIPLSAYVMQLGFFADAWWDHQPRSDQTAQSGKTEHSFRERCWNDAADADSGWCSSGAIVTYCGLTLHPEPDTVDTLTMLLPVVPVFLMNWTYCDIRLSCIPYIFMFLFWFCSTGWILFFQPCSAWLHKFSLSGTINAYLISTRRLVNVSSLCKYTESDEHPPHHYCFFCGTQQDRCGVEAEFMTGHD